MTEAREHGAAATSTPASASRVARAAWRRLNGPHRLHGIDLARGLAIVGMLAAHLFALPEWDGGDPSTWGALASGRSSILFATLAGVSISLVTGGTSPLTGERMSRARSRLAVRAGLIWALGVLLLAFGVPVYVILPAYGILFLLAIPLVGCRGRTLALIALALAMTTPWVQGLLPSMPIDPAGPAWFVAAAIGWPYPFTTWITFLVAGLALGRLDLRRGVVLVRILVVGAVAAALGYALAALSGAAENDPSYLAGVWTARPHSSGLLEVIGSGGFAIAVIALCLLVCRTPVTWLLLPLRALGAMALTAYVGQIVAWSLLAHSLLEESYDLNAFRALEPFWPFTLVALAFCTVWSLTIGRGPLEWLVDRVSRLAAPERAEATGRLEK